MLIFRTKNEGKPIPERPQMRGAQAASAEAYAKLFKMTQLFFDAEKINGYAKMEQSTYLNHAI